jgi:Flp pilus assembly protein TadG
MYRGISNTRGSGAVEFALVLPAFLMFVLGLVDCGRLLWTNGTLAHAVAEASRCAIVNTSACGTAAAVQAYAVTQAWGLGLTSSAFTVTAAACGTQVNGTLNFTFIIPWFFGSAPFGSGNAMTLSAVACYSP